MANQLDLNIEFPDRCDCIFCTWTRKYGKEEGHFWVEGPELNPGWFGDWSLERWEIALEDLLAEYRTRITKNLALPKTLRGPNPDYFENYVEAEPQKHQIAGGLKDLHEMGLLIYLSDHLLSVDDALGGWNYAIDELKVVLEVLGRWKRNEGPGDFELEEPENSQREWGSCMTEDVFEELMEWAQSNKEVT